MPQKSFKRSSIRDTKRPSPVYKNAAGSSMKLLRAKGEGFSDKGSSGDSSSCHVSGHGYHHRSCLSLATAMVLVYGVVAVTALLVDAEKIVIERLFSIPVLAIMGVLLVLQAIACGKKIREMRDN